jgi:hypothetical protein
MGVPTITAYCRNMSCDDTVWKPVNSDACSSKAAPLSFARSMKWRGCLEKSDWLISDVRYMYGIVISRVVTECK